MNIYEFFNTDIFSEELVYIGTIVPISKKRSLWSLQYDESNSKEFLTQNNGRCYIFTLDKKIFKIGYSDCNGGIEGAIDWYEYRAISGRPSVRTTGVHLFFSEALYENIDEYIENFLLEEQEQKEISLIPKQSYPLIEVFCIYTKNVKAMLPTFNGLEEIEVPVSGKILEKIYLKEFKNRVGSYPFLNMQESAKKWPENYYSIYEKLNKQ